MTRAPHDCPGCHRTGVPYERLACPTCWYRLPAELARAVTSTWGRDPAAHADAVVAAVAWYAQCRRDDQARPVGTRRESFGVTMEWTGTMWRHLTAKELDAEARRGQW